MAIPLSDLISGKVSVESVGFDFSLYKCNVCQCECDPSVTGRHRTIGGWLCDDCYYEAMGEEIEKHPIRSLRRKGP